MQQHIAGAIDAHIQAVAAATAVATVAPMTGEDVELWLSRWCMIGREVNKPQIQGGEFDCSRTVPERKNAVKRGFGLQTQRS